MFRVFEKHSGLVVGLSEKTDGQMKLTGDSVRDKIALGNQKRFFNRLDIDERNIVCANLVHGNNVEVAGTQNRGMMMVKTDGLVTAEKNLFLSLTVADCLPVFLYDSTKGNIGLVHAGWKGLAKNILALAVMKMIREFKSRPQDLLAGIGPGISSCHFEVKNDILEKFSEWLAQAQEKRGRKSFLDLKKIAKLQLLKLGLREENIEISPECTFCLKDRYFSSRRDKPKEIEAMAAVIGLC